MNKLANEWWIPAFSVAEKSKHNNAEKLLINLKFEYYLN
jgi:hypothetical protein